MAGYAYGFDEGGAVDDGAIPAFDNAGEGEAPQQQEQTLPTTNEGGMAPVRAVGSMIDQSQHAMQDLEQPSRSGAIPPHAALQNTVKAMILSYLGGADAAPEEAQKKFVAGVEAEHPNLSRDDANVVAVHKAYELGGAPAAWQMVQFNRMAYDANQNFALAALSGTQGKPADVQAAAAAATKASQHVLDGSSAQFQATPDGFVTATVRGPTGVSTSMRLDPAAFARYLNVGADGQYDKVMESGGVPGTLQKLSSQGQQGRAQPDTSAADRRLLEQSNPSLKTGRAVARDVVDADQPELPARLQRPQLRAGSDGTNYGEELEARADAMFGPGLNTGNARERQAWMAAQEEKELERSNKVDVASEKGRNDIEKARVTGAYGVQRADTSGQHRENATVSAADKRLQGTRETNQTRTAIADKGLQQRAAELQQRIRQMEVTHGDRVNRQRLDAASRRLNNVNAAIAKGGAEDVQNAMAEMQNLEKELSAPPQPPAPQQQAPRPQQGQQQGQQLSPQDKAAIDWANAHPGDPRAAKIKQLHGM